MGTLALTLTMPDFWVGLVVGILAGLGIALALGAYWDEGR